MRTADSLKCRLSLYLAAGIALALSLCFPTQLHAQKGYNAVCTATAVANINCSLATLDASQFTGTTICQQIYNALSYLSTLYSPNNDPGAVVDARGITTGLTCSAANETPWTSGTNVVTTPSIILLPAGLITISTGWIIPDRTRVFGEGERSNPGAVHGPGTQIVAASSFSGTMISLGGANLYPNSTTVYPCGGSNGICFGVSIADVMINANFQNVTGIANTSSQELSYVDHINLYGILGTGLSITTNQAQNSGPYSNIACNPGPGGTSGLASTTTCVDINGTGDLRGIHGLTATVGSDSICPGSTCPAAAVYLDSDSTTIEDAHFEGFAAGILVGSVAHAKGDVIINVNGGGSTLTGPTVDVVKISSNASDLAIMGVTASANPSGNANSIHDTLNTPAITLTDPHVALYAIGEAIGSSGYSRFTTSASGLVPTWGAGGGVPGSGSCKTGSLYSNTAGASGSILYLCKASLWVAIN
jgi:hypothetical protein